MKKKKRINTEPFDRNKIPPKQNLLIMPVLLYYDEERET